MVMKLGGGKGGGGGANFLISFLLFSSEERIAQYFVCEMVRLVRLVLQAQAFCIWIEHCYQNFGPINNYFQLEF
jgi:hypothetical protein